MDTTEKGLTVLLVLSAVFAWTMISSGVSRAFTDESWRNQIADHGCAESYLDEKHVRQWRWKECVK